MVFRKKRIAFGSAIALSLVLSLGVEPVVAVFRRLEISAVQPCNIKLPKVKDIPYQCWRYEDSSAKLPVWKYSLGFKFGKLTQSQWTTLKETYSLWNQTAIAEGRSESIAPYDPDHDYWLIDFMPPLMQATNRHRFLSQTQAEKSPVSTILSNCWGTVFELLRLKDSLPNAPSYLMMVPPDEMLKAFETYSNPTEKIQAGDLLLISHRHGDRVYLDHSAVMIDDNILFEKAGAGDAVPYRVIDMATMKKIWRPDVFDYQLRRPNRDIALPHPHSFQSRLGNESVPQTIIADTDPENPSEQYYSIFPLPALTLEQGRALLPPEAYNPIYFQSVQP